MVIWLNGCFGIGKTETAQCLSNLLVHSYIYDPENLGGFLWNNMPPTMARQGDFQDIPLWREFNLTMIRYLYDNNSGDIIVPMTLVNRQYFDEIVSELSNDGIPIIHFILSAPKEIISARLIGRGDAAGSWAHEQIDRCLAALQNEIAGINIETSNRNAMQTAEKILSLIQSHRGKHHEQIVYPPD